MQIEVSKQLSPANVMPKSRISIDRVYDPIPCRLSICFQAKTKTYPCAVQRSVRISLQSPPKLEKTLPSTRWLVVRAMDETSRSMNAGPPRTRAHDKHRTGSVIGRTIGCRWCVCSIARFHIFKMRHSQTHSTCGFSTEFATIIQRVTMESRDLWSEQGLIFIRHIHLHRVAGCLRTRSPDGWPLVGIAGFAL